ncbi:MCM DNA helicase complex subunit [Lobulomyces angularis]|nr:MCM DNA helicase complex subunit [Lobulomyces angularis]
MSDISERKRVREPESQDDVLIEADEIDMGENLFPSDVEIQDDILLDDDENEEGEDLFASDMENDYTRNQEKDFYDEEQIDDEEYEALDATSRQLVEKKLRMQDKERMRREGRLPQAFQNSSDEDEPVSHFPTRRRRKDDALILGDIDVMGDLVVPELAEEELKNVKGRLIDWVQNQAPRELIKKTFRKFLTIYKDSKGLSIYGPRISRIGEGNGETLEISYIHLSETAPILAYYVSSCPTELLKIFDEVALEVVLDVFENYKNIKSEVHVRITDLPVKESLRELRQYHLNTLVRVAGVVTKRTGVFPQLKEIKYDCVKCGDILGPYTQVNDRDMTIRYCPSCTSSGPFNLNTEKTVYRNYQRITLQETPGSVPAGRLPRHREVILLWDLVDSVRPGEEIEVTGTYRNNLDQVLNAKNGFPVFTTVIEANHIFKKEDQFASFKLTESDTKAIRELSKQKNVVQRIVKSMAPSIFGHEDIKRALALSMFSGVPKNPQGKHRVRGDINILLLGDPGTAKSQFLKYIEKTAHRAIYSTGQGASAVGLTAAVHKDPITREWTLEGGALVMADKGICMIDEFDKMNDQDRTSIHEAMEQQSISISKAGIITTLQARCAVIAAANPIRGRYNPQIPFSANVELTEPILSRFDILCVVRDNASPLHDENLARFVCNSHMNSHPSFISEGNATEKTEKTFLDKDIIPQDLLRKYIMYARSHCEPRITEADEDKLARFYSDLRRESLSSGAVPITVRYLESMIRMAEAFAKMQLRDTVIQDDVDRAISVMVKSFVSTQKIGAQRNLEKYLKKYLSFPEDSEEILNHILSNLMNEEWKYFYYNKKKIPDALEVDADTFELKAAEYGVFDVKPFFNCNLFKSNFILDLKKKKIVKKTVLEAEENNADENMEF